MRKNSPSAFLTYGTTSYLVENILIALGVIASNIDMVMHSINKVS